MNVKSPVKLKGIIGSPGVCRARAYVFRRRLEIVQKAIAESEVSREIDRLQSAIEMTRRDITLAQKDALEKHGEKYAAIFDSHLLMLTDPLFIPEVMKKVKKDQVNIESVLRKILDLLTAQFMLIEDDYLRERAVDLKDVGDRLLRHLMGIEGPAKEIGDEPFVLISHEVTPTELIDFSRGRIKGICLESGGSTSHVAILAGALNIPSVFGLADLSKAAHTGDWVFIDTRTEGLVILHPDEESIRQVPPTPSPDKGESIDPHPRTRDGYEPFLGANIGRIEELHMLKENEIRRIGLFRSEFLFMESVDPPGESFQEGIYRKVIEAAPEMAVLRAIDIGSDKPVKYLPFPKESNPSLGFRSIRFALSRPDVLEPQLRAMMRASFAGPTRIIFPMVSVSEELEAIQKMWDKIAREISPPASLEWGIMVEVPSSLFMMDKIGKYTKYVSLGTNDLFQFFYAVDRTNERLIHLAHPLCVPFLRLLMYAVTAAKGEGIKVGICGELAGDPEGFAFLLGLGLDEFSMRPMAVRAIKKLIPQIHLKEITRFVHEMLSGDTDADLRIKIRQAFPGLFPSGPLS